MSLRNLSRRKCLNCSTYYSSLGLRTYFTDIPFPHHDHDPLNTLVTDQDGHYSANPRTCPDFPSSRALRVEPPLLAFPNFFSTGRNTRNKNHHHTDIKSVKKWNFFDSFASTRALYDLRIQPLSFWPLLARFSVNLYFRMFSLKQSIRLFQRR